MSVSNEIYESHTRALSEQVQALKAEVERLTGSLQQVSGNVFRLQRDTDEARAALAEAEQNSRLDRAALDRVNAALAESRESYLTAARNVSRMTDARNEVRAALAAAESRNAALVEALRSLNERGCACAFNEPEQGKCVTCEQVDAALEASPAPAWTRDQLDKVFAAVVSENKANAMQLEVFVWIVRKLNEVSK